jgi:hypothetical protein
MRNAESTSFWFAWELYGVAGTPDSELVSIRPKVHDCIFLLASERLFSLEPRQL